MRSRKARKAHKAAIGLPLRQRSGSAQAALPDFINRVAYAFPGNLRISDGGHGAVNS